MTPPSSPLLSLWNDHSCYFCYDSHQSTSGLSVLGQRIVIPTSFGSSPTIAERGIVVVSHHERLSSCADELLFRPLRHRSGSEALCVVGVSAIIVVDAILGKGIIIAMLCHGRLSMCVEFFTTDLL